MSDFKTLSESFDFSENQLTKPGAVLGTYDYMAPEVLDGQETSFQSDIYALGVILYKMLMGKIPRGKWKRPSAQFYHPSWDTLIEKCLETDLAKRFSSIDEIKSFMQSELLAAIDPQAMSKPSMTSEKSAELEESVELEKPSAAMGKSKIDKPSRRWPKILASLFVLVVILLVWADSYKTKMSLKSLSKFGETQPKKIEMDLLVLGDIKFRKIPAGSFMMGSTQGKPDELPLHKVNFSQHFWMGETEVTQEQWYKIMGHNPSHFASTGLNGSAPGTLELNDFPVENIYWEDCKTFISKLNNRYAAELPKGFQFALPTESQWEYTCRAGTDYVGELGR